MSDGSLHKSRSFQTAYQNIMRKETTLKQESPPMDSSRRHSHVGGKGVWRHSAAKAADNLLRILQDIESDIIVNEDIKKRLEELENIDPSSCCCSSPRGGILPAEHATKASTGSKVLQVEDIKNKYNKLVEAIDEKQGKAKRALADNDDMSTATSYTVTSVSTAGSAKDILNKRKQSSVRSSSEKQPQKGVTKKQQELLQSLREKTRPRSMAPLRSKIQATMTAPALAGGRDGNSKFSAEATKSVNVLGDEHRDDTGDNRVSEQELNIRDRDSVGAGAGVVEAKDESEQKVGIVSDKERKGSQDSNVKLPSTSKSNQQVNEQTDENGVTASNNEKDADNTGERTNITNGGDVKVGDITGEDCKAPTSETRQLSAAEEMKLLQSRIRASRKNAEALTAERQAALAKDCSQSMVAANAQEELAAKHRRERKDEAKKARAIEQMEADAEKRRIAKHQAEVEKRKHDAEEEGSQRQAGEEKEMKLATKEIQQREDGCQKKEELIQMVNQILAHKNVGKNAHYITLGIAPEASSSDIKRSYRKLALKLHPDKDRHNTPNIADAFILVSSAYDTLKDSRKRELYDKLQNRRNGQSPISSAYSPSSPGKDTASSQGPLASNKFGTIPSGTVVTIQNNGMRGTVASYQHSTNLYKIKLDGGMTILSNASSLFQNTIVCLRAYMVQELGSFLVTVSSYWPAGGSYQVSYCCDRTRQKKVATLRPNQFIIPNGTVVRLLGLGPHSEKYGTVINWTERLDARGGDTSYYEVQVSLGVVIKAPMSNLCL